MRLDVHVDPTVELISIVFRLAGSPEYRQGADLPYRRDVDAHFGRYIDHPAVQMAIALREDHGIGYDAPACLATRLANGADPAGEGDRWDGAPLKAFTRQLERFRKDTYFDAFLGKHDAELARVESAWRAWLAGHDVAGWFRSNVVSAEPTSWTVVPGMLVGQHNYGCSVRLADESLLLSPVLGVMVDPGGQIRLDGTTERVLAHELAHGFVNRAFSAEPSLVTPAAALYATVEERMKAKAYGDPTIVLNETGVRALTVVYVGEVLGPAARQLQLEAEIAEGFAWIAPVVEIFEAARQNGPLDLRAVAPQVAVALGGWDPAASDPVFRGPINAAVERVSTFVAPTEGPLGAYASEIHAKFYPNVERVGPTWTSPDPRPLVAYGTPEVPIVGEILRGLGAEVTATGVSLPGVRYDGESLALIAAFPHRDDPTASQLVYTAAAEQDIVDLNSVFHGPTDWLVVRKLGPEHFAPLASGEFLRVAGELLAVPDAAPAVRTYGAEK